MYVEMKDICKQYGSFKASDHVSFGIEKGKPIYTQFQENPDKFLFVAHPEIKKKEWEELV